MNDADLIPDQAPQEEAILLQVHPEMREFSEQVMLLARQHGYLYEIRHASHRYATEILITTPQSYLGNKP